MSNNPFTRRRKHELDTPLDFHDTDQFEEGVCKCGKPIHPVYANRCEDCWVDDHTRWDGRNRRVRLL